eukprot:1144094-Rhodomonas_salina.3
MSGTEIAYGVVLLRCPVLRQRMAAPGGASKSVGRGQRGSVLRPSYAISGTEIGYAVTARRCPAIQRCYAVCGTEIGYAGTKIGYAGTEIGYGATRRARS